MEQFLLGALRYRDVETCWFHGTSHVRAGSYPWKGRRRKIYRIMLDLIGNPVPDDMVVDHLCKNPACYNPFHLEIVTQQENSLRGDVKNRTKTHCPQGHEYDNRNTYIDKKGHRNCRACHNFKSNIRYHNR